MNIPETAALCALTALLAALLKVGVDFACLSGLEQTERWLRRRFRRADGRVHPAVAAFVALSGIRVLQELRGRLLLWLHAQTDGFPAQKLLPVCQTAPGSVETALAPRQSAELAAPVPDGPDFVIVKTGAAPEALPPDCLTAWNGAAQNEEMSGTEETEPARQEPE